MGDDNAAVQRSNDESSDRLANLKTRLSSREAGGQKFSRVGVTERCRVCPELPCAQSIFRYATKSGVRHQTEAKQPVRVTRGGGLLPPVYGFGIRLAAALPLYMSRAWQYRKKWKDKSDEQINGARRASLAAMYAHMVDQKGRRGVWLANTHLHT